MSHKLLTIYEVVLAENFAERVFVTCPRVRLVQRGLVVSMALGVA